MTTYEQDMQVIKYAVAAYGFLIDGAHYPLGLLAHKIRNYYSTDNKRNAEVVRVLTKYANVKVSLT